MKKTLLQINATSNWGVSGDLVETLGKRSLQQGWRSIVAYGRYANRSQSETIKIGGNWSIMWHKIMSKISDRHGFFSSYATNIFIKKIDKIKPDLVHLHKLHGYYINIEILFEYLKKKNIPVIFTLHDCWPITGHYPYINNRVCDRWKEGCFNCPKKSSYPNSIGLEQSKRNYADKKRLFTSLSSLTIVSASKELGEFAKESFLKNFPQIIIESKSTYNRDLSVSDKKKGYDKYVELYKDILKCSDGAV